MRILAWALALVVAASPAWAFRQEVRLCRTEAGWHAVVTPQAAQGCHPLDTHALHARAASGDADALAALLAVVRSVRVLPPFRVAAAQALAWPRKKPLPAVLAEQAEAAFGSRRVPFRAAVALAGFLRGLAKVPAPSEALWDGLIWRLTKAETCPAAASLLVRAGSRARKRMVRAWMDAWKSDEVTSCIERALAPYMREVVGPLGALAQEAPDPRLRMRLVSWIALAGDEAKPVLARLRNDPDARVRRLVASYLGD